MRLTFAPLLLSLLALQTRSQQIYVHLMPWFETRQTSDNGEWGIHWTMATRNPDNIIGENERRDIAAHYYPEIGPYGSGDGALIDYQIQMMKYAGVDGVLVDWPGTANAFDYPKNARNAMAFINALESQGLTFGIVYEDHNLGLAQEGGFIGDIHAQGRQDMEFLQSNYFNRGNYIRINGAPLLLTFGPQTLAVPDDWTNIFSVLNPKPTFLTLWYQEQQAAGSASGEYPWIYSDFINGLVNFYNNHPLNVKFGVAYPGFNTFYEQGGWGGPGWSLPTGLETFGQTLDLAMSSGVQWIQVATWNDYGEGTIVEPTREFGRGYLDILARKTKSPYGDREFELITQLYLRRKEHEGVREVEAQLDAVHAALTAMDPDLAERLLRAVKY